MVRLVAARFAIAAVAVGLCFPVSAQRYQIDTYSEAEGLPSTTVRGVVQDTEGLMWFATRVGIASYDGSSWSYHNRASGLPFVDTGRIFLDSRGTLWSVGVLSPIQAASLDGDRWVAVPPHPGTGPNEYVQGFAVLNLDERSFILAGTGTGWTFVWDGEEWWEFEIAEEREQLCCQTLEIVEEKIFIGSSAGLHVLDPRGLDAGPQPLEGYSGGSILGLEYDATRRRLWIVGKDWIGVMEKGRFDVLARNLDFRLLRESAGPVPTPEKSGG